MIRVYQEIFRKKFLLVLGTLFLLIPTIACAQVISPPNEEGQTTPNVEKEDKTIVEIFRISGENHFRDLEEKISIEKLKNTNQVIALGGGAYLNRNIRKQTLAKSTSFWLNWNSSTLIKRIKDNKKRPLVLNLKINEIKKLIDERSKIYISSDYKINCDKLDKFEIVKKIKDIYEGS